MSVANRHPGHNLGKRLKQLALVVVGVVAHAHDCRSEQSPVQGARHGSVFVIRGSQAAIRPNFLPGRLRPGSALTVSDSQLATKKRVFLRSSIALQSSMDIRALGITVRVTAGNGFQRTASFSQQPLSVDGPAA